MRSCIGNPHDLSNDHSSHGHALRVCAACATSTHQSGRPPTTRSCTCLPQIAIAAGPSEPAAEPAASPPASCAGSAPACHRCSRRHACPGRRCATHACPAPGGRPSGAPGLLRTQNKQNPSVSLLSGSKRSRLDPASCSEEFGRGRKGGPIIPSIIFTLSPSSSVSPLEISMVKRSPHAPHANFTH